MKLTKKDKLVIRSLLSAGNILSNIGFNLGQRREFPEHEQCRDACRKWDATWTNAKEAIRKLKLPPF